MAEEFASIEAYLDSLPPDVRTALEQLRTTIREVVPDGEDVIRYNIPTVQRGGRSIVHYAGWTHHVSLYPAPDGDPDLEREVAPYLTGRSTLKFTLDQPLPLELVAKVVRSLSSGGP